MDHLSVKERITKPVYHWIYSLCSLRTAMYCYKPFVVWRLWYPVRVVTTIKECLLKYNNQLLTSSHTTIPFSFCTSDKQSDWLRRKPMIQTSQKDWILKHAGCLFAVWLQEMTVITPNDVKTDTHLTKSTSPCPHPHRRCYVDSIYKTQKTDYAIEITRPDKVSDV